MRFTAFDRYYPITWAIPCRVVRIRNRCCPDTGQLLLLLFGWTNLSIINYKFALCQKSITGSRIKGYKHATATQTADKLLFLFSRGLAAVKDLKQWFEAFFRSDCCWMMGCWSWFLKNGLLCYVPIPILRGIICATNNRFVQRIIKYSWNCPECESKPWDGYVVALWAISGNRQ